MKFKVINNNLDGNLVGENFKSPINQLFYSLGGFQMTSNFSESERGINYESKMSSFSAPITLDTLSLDIYKSKDYFERKNIIDLNIDYSELGSFVRFGSTREYLRSCVENIIMKFPSGLFINSFDNNKVTIIDYHYDDNTKKSSFKTPINAIENPFSIIINRYDDEIMNDDDLTNINKSYSKFIINPKERINDEYTIISFTGSTENDEYLYFEVMGNPFPNINNTVESLDYYIRPNKKEFDAFKFKLINFEKHITSRRNNNGEFHFIMKIPIENEAGEILYDETELIWTSKDGYNIDISGSNYSNFLNALYNIGESYDLLKTDLIYNFLVPKSIINYDLTSEKKITKLLKIYGGQFDKIRVFIDSLLYIYDLSYDNINNTPNALLRNLSKTFGWEDLFIRMEKEFVEHIFSPIEYDGGDGITYENINIELWRRILLNTNYYWKSKGTRHCVISILKLLGIPMEYIAFNEYIYTADYRINPNNVELELDDFPTDSLPYDSDGYHKSPLEDINFFFQTSGITDNGQRYLDVFRKVGFDIYPEIDNLKITHYDENNYINKRNIDNRLIINTKIIDINVDSAKAVETDFYDYIINVDIPASEKDYYINAAYITIPLTSINEEFRKFELPELYDPEISDLNVRFNGVHLDHFPDFIFNEEPDDNIFDEENYDYVIYKKNNKHKIKLKNFYEGLDDNIYDLILDSVLQITYLRKDGEGMIDDLNIKYVLNKIKFGTGVAFITLPEKPKGSIQLILGSSETGGIVLTEKKQGMVYGDFMFVTNTQIKILNTDLISWLSNNPYILISYITHDIHSEINNDLELRSESVRYTGVNVPKLYKKVFEGSEKYVYKLNYKSYKTKNVKILLDGLSLKPYEDGDLDHEWDYMLNNDDLYEIILNTNKINIGSIISAHYLIGDDAIQMIIPNIDDENISFIEFIDILSSEYVDVRNRKTITDHSSGWYPLLLKYYTSYIKRGFLNNNSPLKSNKVNFFYTLNFLNKYSFALSTFIGFVRQLTPATSIIRKEGVLIRNTVYTKQKYKYIRGVSFNKNPDWKEYFNDYYIGDDGSYFKKEYVVEEVNWFNNINFIKYDEENNSGYLGVINNLITENELIETIFGEDKTFGKQPYLLFNNEWLGFYHNNSYLYIAKRPIRVVSWDDIYKFGGVYGNDEIDGFNKHYKIIQNKKIKIINQDSPFLGLTFKVRLLKGSNENPSTEAGGEWNDLMYRVCSITNGDWDNLSHIDLGISRLFNHASWCQESSLMDDDSRILRGKNTIRDVFYEKSNKLLSYAWRPVLELYNYK